MKYEHEFEMLRRRGADYGELLRMGHVESNTSEPDSWRASIRAQARADKLRVSTGADSRGAWALLIRRGPPTDDEMDLALRQLDAVPEALSRALLRGHRITRLVGAQAGRVAAICPDCGARLYLDCSQVPPHIEGEVFEWDCSAEGGCE